LSFGAATADEFDVDNPDPVVPALLEHPATASARPAMPAMPATQRRCFPSMVLVPLSRASVQALDPSSSVPV
jgi:hypothetical protein